VPVAQVVESAKPLPKQTIDKPKVWVAFIGGAVAVFGLTVLSENNEAWFPAISRANKAMAMTKKRMEVCGPGRTVGPARVGPRGVRVVCEVALAAGEVARRRPEP
jgi:hypothetical protein